ncbi:hypothetical protein M422DRAFT_259978 [Sphaerobolus stellatus SS14]|uniref:Uncharacterized protein n=1 Tax=Sphaerobolus stellatus (strain SS14) TaxID=990650 RepID=A0A0C9US16_SPHS4|nr:hypothetical protein M422DRAFT_259978 [Sphaerobolus stellatus SS14]
MRLCLAFAPSRLTHELVFPDALPHYPHPSPTASLPLPDGWRRHIHLLEEMGLPQPRNVHALDRTVAWVVLLEEVLFDLDSSTITCRFLNGFTTTFPLEEKYVNKLSSIPEAYARARRENAAEHAASFARRWERRPASINPIQQTMPARKRNKLIKRARPGLQRKEASEPGALPCFASQPPSSTPQALHPSPSTHPAPSIPSWFRRTTRPILVDTYRLAVVPVLTTSFWTQSTLREMRVRELVRCGFDSRDFESAAGYNANRDAELNVKRGPALTVTPITHSALAEDASYDARLQRACGPHYALWTVRSVVNQIGSKIEEMEYQHMTRAANGGGDDPATPGLEGEGGGDGFGEDSDTDESVRTPVEVHEVLPASPSSTNFNNKTQSFHALQPRPQHHEHPDPPPHSALHTAHTHYSTLLHALERTARLDMLDEIGAADPEMAAHLAMQKHQMAGGHGASAGNSSASYSNNGRSGNKRIPGGGVSFGCKFAARKERRGSMLRHEVKVRSFEEQEAEEMEWWALEEELRAWRDAGGVSDEGSEGEDEGEKDMRIPSSPPGLSSSSPDPTTAIPAPSRRRCIALCATAEERLVKDARRRIVSPRDVVAFFERDVLRHEEGEADVEGGERVVGEVLDEKEMGEDKDVDVFVLDRMGDLRMGRERVVAA